MQTCKYVPHSHTTSARTVFRRYRQYSYTIKQAKCEFELEENYMTARTSYCLLIQKQLLCRHALLAVTKQYSTNVYTRNHHKGARFFSLYKIDTFGMRLNTALNY